MNLSRFPVHYRPHTAQLRAHIRLKGKRFIITCAGRRGGKTQLGAAEFCRRVLADLAAWMRLHGAWSPGGGKEPKASVQYMVVAPTYALLVEPRVALQHYLGGMVAQGGIIVSQTKETWWLIGGVRIDFRSADKPERLVSQGLNGVWIEEAARCKASAWVDNLRPTLSDKLGWGIFTTTPMGKNWLWKECWAKGDASAAAELAMIDGHNVNDILDDEYGCLAWTTADNDALPHLVEEMERARRTLPWAYFARNYLASFETFIGQLFQLDRGRHFATEAPPLNLYARRKAAGIDLGTTHKTSASLVVEDKHGVWHEVATDAESNVLFDDAESWSRRDYGDRGCWTSRVYQMLTGYAGSLWATIPLKMPADRPDIRRLFQNRGFRVESAYQEHAPAVDFIAMALHSNKLRLRSPSLWRCMEALHTPERGKRSTKLWVDLDDDEWDGFRYAMSDPIGLGEIPAVGTYTALRSRTG